MWRQLNLAVVALLQAVPVGVVLAIEGQPWGALLSANSSSVPLVRERLLGHLMGFSWSLSCTPKSIGMAIAQLLVSFSTLRSLRVVHLADAPVPSNRPLPHQAYMYHASSMWYFAPFPMVQQAAVPPFDEITLSKTNFPAGAMFVVYAEYNFRGTRRVVTY
ncbi:Aste57867_15996 [Aphanomyces stellatus]|uniref:Aste57867_15996 protein n=1 Tax=Aphanomyces stellatus TaxID=120398 RepID=A0A485L5G4_9STRA|nr:hypothetical protein As57867_015940 [Aphanomyces stellatus]VFT92781.1 Aste57867_15996 [Aphanomyces stellatus]